MKKPSGFRRVLFPSTIPDPQVGELWELVGYEVDPFGIHGEITAEVCEIKDGWVRYRWVGTTGPATETHTVRTFKRLYYNTGAVR